MPWKYKFDSYLLHINLYKIMLKSILINLTSKNKKSLKLFLQFLIINMKKITKVNIKGNFQKKQKKKFISILKSPHVHKKAQEQFEYNVFFTNIKLYPLKNLQTFLTFKKFNIKLLSDIKPKIKFVIDINKLNKNNNPIYSIFSRKLNKKIVNSLIKNQTLYLLNNLELKV